MLIRIRYASTLAPDTTPTDIDDVVEWSTGWNRAHQITGVLAVEGDMVMQILEGPDAEVLKLFASIRSDSRHFGVVELQNEPIVSCRFADWGLARLSMAEMLMLAEALDAKP